MSRALRALFAGLLLLLIAAPTPGAVGSCGSDDDGLDQTADLEAYCSERGQLICVRAYERGDLSLVARDNCRREAIAACERRTFLPGCRPTQRAANACLNALHSRSTLDQMVDEIDECTRLCPLQNEAPRSIDTPTGDRPSDAGTAADGGDGP
jgi:hypothetical protein